MIPLLLLLMLSPPAQARLPQRAERASPAPQNAVDYPESLQEAVRISNRYQELLRQADYKSLVQGAREYAAQAAKAPNAVVPASVDTECVFNETIIGIESIRQSLKSALEACPTEVRETVTASALPPVPSATFGLDLKKLSSCNLGFTSLQDLLLRWMRYYEFSQRGNADVLRGVSPEWNDIRTVYEAANLASQFARRRPPLSGPLTINFIEASRLAALSTSSCNIVGYKMWNPYLGYQILESCKLAVNRPFVGGLTPWEAETVLELIRALYARLFSVAAANPAVTWTETPSGVELRLAVQTADPIRLSRYQGVLDGVWKSEGFRVVLVNDPSRPNALKIIENQGVLSAANHLDGNEIALDSNDVDDGYTFGHEIGHILGFPDCYFEFWDGQKQEVVNIEVDPQNMMCSAVKHAGPKHAEALRAAYGPPAAVRP
jgi:hypothetical protein